MQMRDGRRPLQSVSVSILDFFRWKVTNQNSAELDCSNNSRNGDLVSSILALITEYLIEFRSEMITIINKSENPPVSLKHRDSYYEGFDTTNTA